MIAAAFNIIIWGLILSCFAGVSNYSGALAIRFFLGVFEAAVSFSIPKFSTLQKKKRKHLTKSFHSFKGNPRLRPLHLPMVHHRRTRLPHRHLVQLQRVRANLRRLPRLRHRRRMPQTRHLHRTLEDCFPSNGPADGVLRRGFSVDSTG